MYSPRIRNLLATTVAAACVLPALAQIDVSGSLSVGAGGSLLDGNRAAFQSHRMHQKDGFGGIEELVIRHETDDGLLTVRGQAMLGDEAYALTLRYNRGEAYYIDAGYTTFRTFYDADGGYLPPAANWLPVIADVAAVDRSKLWFELGLTPEDKPHWVFRYQRDTRDGTKGSTHWADTNLTTPAGKYIVPSFYDLNETRDTITIDVSSTGSDLKWKGGVRYQETELENLKNTRRRPYETADRYVTTRDETSSDLFAMHGYVDKVLSEKLRFSAGAIHTRLDSQLDGTRIFGSTGYDPIYNPAYPTRQQRDEGYYNLTGENQLRQTVGNVNLVYTPAPGWKIMPTLRFEDLRVENVSEFIETAVGGGTTRPMAEEELEGLSNKDWLEVSGRVEVRYTGVENWAQTFRAEWLRGDGELMEELIDVHTGAVGPDRDTELTRDTQQYTYTANWYAKPGLSFAGGGYYRLRINDFTNVRDSTPAAGADRYPAYIIGQDFETTDLNVRMTWRPRANLTLVTRYDWQDNSVVTTEAGFLKGESSTLESRILSQSFTWLPKPQMYFMGSVNLVKDELATPAAARVLDAENDYLSGTLTAGFAVSEASDLVFDYGYNRADNYVDSTALSVPYLSGFKQAYGSATWVYRLSEHLVYTLRYSLATNRELLAGGFNNYDAHTLYTKIQYRF